MSEKTKSPVRHLVGLTAAVLALAVILWAWQDGLNFLNGTVFSELRYLAFAGFVVVFLTAVNKVMDRFF
ncbi:hypothetical protein [Roseibium aggregatum]|uniref:Uncharacterized protein n=1 Tax=Roseibium aggregatum TaxID=187304 RepID=A0A926P260_9HYPH|nr:hypothetical protein [Roseibium aggregatum]MBD1548133.1 hypothetical protein [Roseibium aggregatum]